MALYKDPVDTIFNTAENLNKVTLVREHYTLGNPVEWVDPQGLTNTQISITATNQLSAYEGMQTLNYTRLNLADLSKFLPNPILGYNLTTVAQVAALLNTNYGLNFVANDLVAGPVTTVDDVGTVELTASATSKGWFGTVTINLARGNIPIDTAVANKTIDGVLYPNRDETKVFGEMETYWRDFSSREADLATITPEVPNLALVASILTENTGNTWVSGSSGRYSLQNATVLYNGETIGYPRSNQTRGYVLVIRLGNGSLGLSGDLFLHYGLIPLTP